MSRIVRSPITQQPRSSTTQEPSAPTGSKPGGHTSTSLRRSANRDPLVGRYFHSFAPKDKYPDAPTRIVEWQGYVLGRVDDHTYLIELFSWDDGAPNGQQLQPLAGMPDWKFYSSASDMKDWYSDEYCPRVRDYSFEAAE